MIKKYKQRNIQEYQKIEKAVKEGFNKVAENIKNSNLGLPINTSSKGYICK